MTALASAPKRETACGVLFMGLGAVVIYGWFSDQAILTQFHPSLVPIQYNSALGFIICGLGLLGLSWQKQSLITVSGSFVCAFGIFFLIQFISESDAALGLAFAQQNGHSADAGLGHLPASTSLCFCLFGAYLLLSAYYRHRPSETLRILRILPPALLLALASIVSIAHIVELEPSYNWAQHSGMPIQTAAGFVLLGGSSIFSPLSDTNPHHGQFFRPALLGIIMGIATIMLWAALEAEEHAKLRQLLDVKASLTKDRLQLEFEQHQLALQRMAERIEAGSTKPQWGRHAVSYLRDIPPLQELSVLHSDQDNWQAARGQNSPAPANTSSSGSVFIPLSFHANPQTQLLAQYELTLPLRQAFAELPDGFAASASVGGEKVERNEHGQLHFWQSSEIVSFQLHDTPLQLQLHSNGKKIPGYGGSGSTLTLIVGLILSAVTMLTSILLTRARQIQQELQRSKEAMQQEIDARKALQLELERNQKKLESTVEALEDFAYVASHDLKEPLRGIRHLVRFVSEDNSDQLDAKGRERLATMSAQTTYLSNLIDDLLTYSRAGRDIRREMVDLDALLHDVLNSLDHMIQEQQAKIILPNKLGSAACDRAATGEVFRNLVTNAIKYNDHTEKLIEIGVDGHKTPATYYVKDNGIGIEEDDHDEVFRIFSRLFDRNEYGGGTGAGLTIVKKIVENQGGQIYFESEPGCGTCFFFTLSSSPSSTA